MSPVLLVLVAWVAGSIATGFVVAHGGIRRRRQEAEDRRS